MEAKAKAPGIDGDGTALEAVGYQVHKLLSLSAELSRVAEPRGVGAAAWGTLTGPLGVDLDELSDAETVAWAQDLESAQRIIGALQVHVAGTLADRVRTMRFSDSGVTKPVALLTSSLRISPAEAFRRLALVDSLLPAVDSLTGQISPSDHPVLGRAFFAGELSTEQALIASKFADEASHLAAANRITEDEAQRVESTLSWYAVAETPDFLRRIGLRIINGLDPDGMQPTEGQLTAKQGIHFGKPRRGLIHVDGHLTVQQYETVMSGIGWASNPNAYRDDGRLKAANNEDLVGQDGRDECMPEQGMKIPAPGSSEELTGLEMIDPESTDPAVKDSRTYAQKLLDGLIHCIRRASGSGKLSLNGGLRPQLFITTSQSDLDRRVSPGTDHSVDSRESAGGLAFLPYSGPQPLGLLGEDLCDVEVTRIMMSEGQNIVGVGRSQRLFTPAQRKVLLARDLGCTFPDCTAPPQWCEAHHIIPWQSGGLTDLTMLLYSAAITTP